MKKRILSIVLAIAMLATLVPVGIFASADAPQEFSTWDAIANAINMNYGEGSYKLTADSAATVSVVGFYGTFDGGDHTITTSTTLFDEIGGGATIKNFTVNQAKDTNGDDMVFYKNPVVRLAAGSTFEFPIWISGVTNNVNVSEDTSFDQDPTAGILGYADSLNCIYIYDVVNNGDMRSNDLTGGIIGNCGHASGHTYLTIVNVVNNGEVYSTKNYAGGIVANANDQLTADFRYCINNGNVTAENNAGGMIAQVYGKADVKFSYCANSGIIDQNPIINTETGEKLAGGDKTGTKYGVAGICPRFSDVNTTVTMDNCVVMGALDNDSTADGSACSSADPFNAWNWNGLADITITNSSYLVGMNAIGEYAATLQDGATGFAALSEAECQEKFDAIVADAPKQPAPEIEIPELTPVDLVNVNGYVAPTEGADIAESLAGITVPKGANYSIYDAYWYNETLGRTERGGTFIAGCAYHLYVEINVASGYVFADDLVMQFNGDASLVDRDFGYCFSEGGYAYLYSVATELPAEGGDDPTDSTVIDTINVNGYVAPTLGANLVDALANLSVPDGAPYSITDACWYNETLEDYVRDGEFCAGYGYSLEIIIELNDGYTLAPEYSIMINGDESLVGHYWIDDTGALRFNSVDTQFEGEIISVDTANVIGYVAPTAGADIAENLAGITVPEGAPYSIFYAEWFDVTLGESVNSGTFIAGHSYYLEINIEISDGYIFDNYITMQLNGDASLIDPSYGGNTNASGYYHSVVTELPAPAEFFTFASGADTTYVSIDETNGHLVFKAGSKTAADVIALFADTGVSITKANGNAISETAKVGTTCIITSTINGESKSLTVVVVGDLTGDGNVNALDCTKCALHVKSTTPITDPAVLAAANALSNSATINALDINRIGLFIKDKIQNF